MHDIVREIGAKRLELVTPKKDILYRYITKINLQPRSVPNNGYRDIFGRGKCKEIFYESQLSAGTI